MRKENTRNFKGEYVETRCLRNERFLWSDEYCVKETNEEKRKQRNIMALFIESWGFRGSVSLFPSTCPFIPRFLLSLSPTFRPKTRSERSASLCTVQPPLATYPVRTIIRFWEKLPTYPSPKPTSTLTSHLEQNVGLGEG